MAYLEKIIPRAGYETILLTYQILFETMIEFKLFEKTMRDVLSSVDVWDTVEKRVYKDGQVRVYITNSPLCHFPEIIDFLDKEDYIEVVPYLEELFTIPIEEDTKITISHRIKTVMGITKFLGH